MAAEFQLLWLLVEFPVAALEPYSFSALYAIAVVNEMHCVQ